MVGFGGGGPGAGDVGRQRRAQRTRRDVQASPPGVLFRAKRRGNDEAAPPCTCKGLGVPQPGPSQHEGSQGPSGGTGHSQRAGHGAKGPRHGGRALGMTLAHGWRGRAWKRHAPGSRAGNQTGLSQWAERRGVGGRAGRARETWPPLRPRVPCTEGASGPVWGPWSTGRSGGPWNHAED